MNTRAFWPWQLDLRSLGVFRMALGVVMLIHLLHRAQDYAMWYTEAGIVPRATATALNGVPPLGWFALSDSLAWGYLGLALSALLALTLTLGFRSRLSAGLLAVMLLSLNLRNPWILSGGDSVLQLSLIWAALLPVGARFSLDGRADTGTPQQWAGIAALGFTLQIGFSYLFNALYKTGAGWHDGTALNQLLHYDMSTRWPGAAVLAALPDGVRTAISFGVVPLEFAALFLLLLPWPWVRLATVGALMLMHTGFLVSMAVGVFPLACLAWLTALLPPLVWRTAGEWSGRAPRMAERARFPGFIATSLAAALTAIVTVLNFVEWQRGVSDLKEPLTATGVYQRWNKFAPDPFPFTGHYVVQARLQSGRTVDLYRALLTDRGTQVSFAPERNLPGWYGGQWWNYEDDNLKRLHPMMGAYSPAVAEPLARYLTRQWEAQSPDRVQSAEVILVVYALNGSTQARTVWSGASATALH